MKWTRLGTKILLVAGHITNAASWTIPYVKGEQKILNFDSPGDDTTGPQIITGAFRGEGKPPEIRIYSESGSLNWTWNAVDNGQNIDSSSRKCAAGFNPVQDVKWSKDRTKIAAIVGSSAIVVQYTPNHPKTDKKALFAMCMNRHPSAHALEFLPDSRLAIATTGKTRDDGIFIYDISKSTTNSPIQEIKGFPAVHGLVWDEKDQILWAAGNNVAPDATNTISTSILQAFRYNCLCSNNLLPLQEPFVRYQVADFKRLMIEWGGSSYANWWDGSHDMVPVPGERKLLMATDLELHLFDLTTRTFSHGDEVAVNYLPGFKPVGVRKGTNSTDQCEEIPRSDIKSMGLASGKRTVYVQPEWKTESALANEVQVAVNGTSISPVKLGRNVYRARWFESIEGWPPAA